MNNKEVENMKRLYGIVIFLIVCCFIPICGYASDYGIENFNMHVTVLPNGDLYVRELFTMNGSFNGMDRDILFKNPNAPIFDESKIESFEGSDIYNGTNIELVQIRSIPYTNSISWKELETAGTLFEEVSTASSGQSGVYTVSRNSNGESYRIFNPSSNRSAFYLEYILKDMAIQHNDISELGWNIFSKEFRESIHHLKVDIYLTNNKEDLRAWAHGPLTGEITLDGKNHVILTIDDLPAYTAIDTRIAFDQDFLIAPKKTTSINALDSIIQLETKLADEANQLREEARRQVEEEQKRIKRGRIIFGIVGGIWIIGLGVLIRYVYKKHDKEYASTFKTQYFRDFPADYNPSTVGYLFHRSISSNDLSACLLNLIYKKAVTFEKIDKKDYKLTYYENKIALTKADEKLVKLIFTKPEITLSEIKKKAKSGYSTFIKNYTEWQSVAKEDAEQEGFYETKIKIKALSSLYSLLGLAIGIFSMQYSVVIGLIALASALISLIYFLSFTKKTKKGNEHYLKWKALKRFMEDFGRIDKKDLPEIVLWEKYMVYAVSLGCADKLAKTMELRINEFSEYDAMNMMYDMHMMRDMMYFNHVVNSSINSAVNSAYSAQSIANSSNSSGGGHGGGFSGGFSGGGSFGGGSGGGRF